MQKKIIVSNRLPVQISRSEEGLTVAPSAGGLATGLKSYHKGNGGLWMGWPGLSTSTVQEENEITELLKKENCAPIFLDERLIENYYNGFSNATIWPLFHYFSKYATFRGTFWRAYLEVNRLFAERILEVAEDHDTIWVHDYQLMLLPQLLRDIKPTLKIGFFLHIPFPSYELFRTLPWRSEILEGLLGADLIGFHTYDYARHLISSVKRILGYETNFTKLNIGNRKVEIEVFPMSIDFAKFNDLAYQIKQKPKEELSKERQDLDLLREHNPQLKLILSIDRLDYTKGITERLRAFALLLRNRPEYQEKISFIMQIVPSREMVDEYQSLKSELEEMVASINGEFGSIGWTPVIYFYRSLPFNSLVELYNATDIALLTPLRDGMNLVAKEFIACQLLKTGVLILSEMTGAAKELGEALLVNPNNILEVSNAIHEALSMPEEEAIRRIDIMQDRLRTYDVHHWAETFVGALEKVGSKNEKKEMKAINKEVKSKIFNDFNRANRRAIFLDYDGTLKELFREPGGAKPDEELFKVLDALNDLPELELIITSGRGKNNMDDWLAHKPYHLMAEHGLWTRLRGSSWLTKKTASTSWIKNIRPLLESYTYRTPGSLIEEKTHSLVWHYRKAEIELGEIRVSELHNDLSNMIQNQDLELIEGKYLLEVKPSGLNKGTTMNEYLSSDLFDFVMIMGDDVTDEFMFLAAPDKSYTVKVGEGNSNARYQIENPEEVRKLLRELTEVDGKGKS